MEALSSYGVLNVRPVSVSGSELCKFYSRPLDGKLIADDDADIEYKSENDEPTPPSKRAYKIKFTPASTQTDYRENETQTDPWDPPFVVKKIFKEPEVLQLKELSYGNGLPVSQIEIDYILESRRNKSCEISASNDESYETFLNKRERICNQIENEWKYKISKQSEKLLEKLKQMEITLAHELTAKSERQEKLLKNLWTQKKEQMSKMNLKLQKELKKELKILEKRAMSGSQRFDAKAYDVNLVPKELAFHISKNRESLNRDIDYLLAKYHRSPSGLSKLTNWLEKKRTDLYNEIPLPKPVQRSKRDKLIEQAYQDLLVRKKTKMPPKIYREDYEKEESEASSIKSEVEFEILEPPEEGVDLVTVWQQVLRGRAYQKQMLELIEKHKDGLDVLLSTQAVGNL